MATTKRRKYIFNSREAAESAYNSMGRSHTILHIALNYVLCGEVHWLPQRGEYRVGIAGAERMDGGFVILGFIHDGQRPSYTAYYLDEWCSEQQRLLRVGCADAMLLATLASEVRCFANDAQRAA